jgi:hypothetical protein
MPETKDTPKSSAQNPVFGFAEIGEGFKFFFA